MFANILAVFLITVFWLGSGDDAFCATKEGTDLNIPVDLDSLLKGGTAKSRFDIGGYLRNETAYRINEPRSFTKLRNVLGLHSQYDISDWGRFYASGWGYYDAIYDFVNYETIAARPERESTQVLVFVEQLPEERDDKRLELRELYLDLYLPNFDIRVGKQYVIWGVLEGIRVVDEINPIDFHELILPDLLEYRIPLWTLKINFYTENTRSEFIWIPDLRFHKPAPSGSEWELFQVLPQTTAPTTFDPLHSEVGFKFSRKIFGADVSWSYFYTWDDYPSTFRIISRRDVTTANTNVSLPILPTYTRMTVYGTTITKEFGGNIVKGELAFVTDKYFAIVDKYENNYLVDDGEVKKNHIRWGLGYDFSFAGWDFGPAIAQWIILDYTREVLAHQYDTTLNLYMRHPLLKRSAVFSMLAIGLVQFQELYLKPKITFDLTDKFQVALGADYFIGAKTQFGRAFSSTDAGGLADLEQRAQFLGNFRGNKRVFVELKYNF